MRVSFTLSPADGYGEDIDVNEAYVPQKLNQFEQVLPETVDFSKYPHLQDLRFPEVDVKCVSILVGSNVPNAHLQRDVRAPTEKNNGIHLVGALQAHLPTRDAKGLQLTSSLSVSTPTI